MDNTHTSGGQLTADSVEKVPPQFLSRKERERR